MNERRFVKTLKGMGPRITVTDVIHQAPLAAYERELARFDWIASGIRQSRRKLLIHEWIELTRHGRAPGVLERAIVGLALSKNELAHLALLDLHPPKDLELLHRIAVFRSAG